MQRSSIEYLRGPDGKEGFTWNPIKMRCTPAGLECANCWHIRYTERFKASPSVSKKVQTAYSGGEPHLAETELDAPLKCKERAKVAVQLMGDLFHAKISPIWMLRIFERIQISDHTFLVLTKRAIRMRDFVATIMQGELPGNVWMGVSAGTRQAWYERVPILRQIPSLVRWVSVEPMIEDLETVDLTGISWVVCGAETGPKKRPCRPEWIDRLRQQCKAASVPFFGKIDEDGCPIGPREYPEAARTSRGSGK